MKSLFTILLLLVVQIFAISQEFAPIGAVWHVEVAEPFAPEWSGTLTNESIRDTTLKGLDCKVIFKSQPTIFNEIFGEYILCQQGDSISHYIETLDSMNLVMDFGAQIGESWESFDRANEFQSFGTQNNYKYTVDSISYLILDNDDSLKVQHLTVLQKNWSQPESEYFWNWQTDQLIERIGFRSALLPRNGGDGLTDDQFETDVRCYQDNNFGLVKLTEESNCITSSTEDLSNVQLKIYPSPTNGMVRIAGLDEYENVKLTLFDYSGNQIEEFLNINELNIGHLENGIYFLNISSPKLMVTEKILLIK